MTTQPSTDLPPASVAEWLASLPLTERREVLSDLTPGARRALPWAWRKIWARPEQLAPAGDWLTWVLRAGRGFGKTRAEAMWTHERAMAEAGRWIALVGRTPSDTRDHLLDSPGGLLKNVSPSERPRFEPSKRRLTWKNGSYATLFSDEVPDQLRGFSGDTAILDEFAKWRHPRECWEMLQFGMRESSSDQPRTVIGTTPRPISILREIEARPSTVVVTGSSYANRANLDPRWFAEVLSQFEGTHLGRQEIHAEILDSMPGALWTREMIEATRPPPHRPLPDLKRVVVGIDPALTAGEHSDMTGIVVAGRGVDGRLYVLEDCTVRASPEVWARRAIKAYRDHEADRLVAEVNAGLDLVSAVLRAVDRSIPIKEVKATRGKRIRAEPIAALYEQGKATHVKPFPELEDQMCNFVPGMVSESPDRMDSLVWAATDLMLKNEAVIRIGGGSWR